MGAKGKRDYLLQHSQLKLNATLVQQHMHAWDEQSIAARTSSLVHRILAIWPCPEDAEQPLGASTPAPQEASLPVEEPWGVDDDSVEAAARLWLALNTTTRRLFETFMDLAPDKVAAPDVAQLLDLDSGALGVAGLLSWPGRVATTLGRPLPVSWEEGEPSSYWIDESVAATLAAGAQLAASEDFIAEHLGSHVHARPSRRGPRRSVPAHILEVFASLPSGAEPTVREIAASSSAAYAADEISHGAIAASLDAGNVDGIEWVPGSSPKRARRKL